MIIIRRSQDRGFSQTGWLKSYHSFSFAEYHDKNWLGFHSLRVINEDYIAAKQGFGLHPHRDMEIITYVIHGALKHQDSMGNSSVITPGEIQRMSAGTGVQHSEFNYSALEELHLLQIWIVPEQKGLTPGYEQKAIANVTNQLLLIGSANKTEHAVTIHQDVKLFVGYYSKNAAFSYPLANRALWLQLIKGRLKSNTFELKPGDGLGIQQETELHCQCTEDAEFLLFDLKEGG